MRANEFVKKFGLKLAQRDIAALDSGFIKHDDFLEHYGFDILDNLKRLVESHELIEACGGIDVVKRHLKEGNVFRFEEKPLMRQAIADVESCQ